MSDDPVLEPEYNPEVGLPVHPDNDWHVAEIIGHRWTAGEIHAALAAAGFEPFAVDESMFEPDENGDPVPLRLFRSRRWVKGDRALRVPMNPDQIVSPYLAACCAALLA